MRGLMAGPPKRVLTRGRIAVVAQSRAGCRWSIRAWCALRMGLPPAESRLRPGSHWPDTVGIGLRSAQNAMSKTARDAEGVDRCVEVTLLGWKGPTPAVRLPQEERHTRTLKNEGDGKSANQRVLPPTSSTVIGTNSPLGFDRAACSPHHSCRHRWEHLRTDITLRMRRTPKRTRESNRERGVGMKGRRIRQAIFHVVCLKHAPPNNISTSQKDTLHMDAMPSTRGRCM